MFHPGDYVVLGLIAAGLIALGILFLYSYIANRRDDRATAWSIMLDGAYKANEKIHSISSVRKFTKGLLDSHRLVVFLNVGHRLPSLPIAEWQAHNDIAYIESASVHYRDGDVVNAIVGFVCGTTWEYTEITLLAPEGCDRLVRHIVEVFAQMVEAGKVAPVKVNTASVQDHARVPAAPRPDRLPVHAPVHTPPAPPGEPSAVGPSRRISKLAG
jgi:hypothetical protein